MVVKTMTTMSTRKLRNFHKSQRLLMSDLWKFSCRKSFRKESGRQWVWTEMEVEVDLEVSDMIQMVKMFLHLQEDRWEEDMIQMEMRLLQEGG